jgi:hypothetical protein
MSVIVISPIPSVIIYDFHVVGVAVSPGKADAPLPVDADAVLSGPVAG